jgi:hypothetical protein
MARAQKKWCQLVLCAACALGGLFTVQLRGADQADAGAPTPGIRQLVSKHLTLYTDLPSSGEVDALPGYFDQAFPQWCAYFDLDVQHHADWHARCYLMKVPGRFQAAGLMPADLPEFSSGYTRNDELWLYDQTSAYYRRHLLLHEGTHALMYSLVGAASSPWYFEGVAELLATHRLEGGKLTLNYFPRSRDEVPKLGRIEIVQAGCAARRAMSLTKILAYDNRAHFQNDPYGWCWAAAAFLDGHPRYRDRFRRLPRLAGEHDFGQHVMKLFAADWDRVNEDWQLYVASLDYGYDFEKMDVAFVAGKPLAAEGARLSVAVDRGWQSTGVQVEAGQKYQLRASGRYEVAQEPRAWECEPGGVTIRYYHGQPLGILLAAIRADDAGGRDPSGLLKPIAVGLATTLDVQQSGTLYLRINDSAGGLGDNAGSLSVEIARP